MSQINNILRMLLGGAAVSSTQSSVNLGSAGSYGALAPASISNTGTTVINGNVGSTGTSVTGFPPGLYTGSLNVDNGAADQAQTDFTAAYIQGQGLSSTMSYGAMASLAGLELVPGVYSFDSAVDLDGTLTLSGAGEYVIQIGSSLTTSSGAVVRLTNGASACSVYWIVESAATLGSTTAFAGNLLTGTGITLVSGATVEGGLYAGSAIVLDDNVVTACGATSGPNNSTTSSSTLPTNSGSLSTSSTTFNSTMGAPGTTSTSSTIAPTTFSISTTSQNSTSGLSSPVITKSSGSITVTHTCTESIVSPVVPPVYYSSTPIVTTTITTIVDALPSGYE